MSSSEGSSSPMPFPIPLVAPPPRTDATQLVEWLEARSPYVKRLDAEDWRTYQKVRNRKNARKTYKTKVTNEETGELARLEFSDKAAVSIL